VRTTLFNAKAQRREDAKKSSFLCVKDGLALANALFDAPLPWADILKRIAGLDILPTTEGSAEISAWMKDVRRAGLFSARTNSARYLKEIQPILADYVSGKINLATAQLKMQEWLQKLGYTPDGGFPGGASVPPANSLLQNLASDERTKLVIETISRHALSTGMAQRQNTPSLLHGFPCWEFLRLYWRKHPRGETDKDNDEGWPQRWARCGGEFYDGRMIARKDSDLWEQLGDSGVWSDGMDTHCQPGA